MMKKILIISILFFLLVSVAVMAKDPAEKSTPLPEEEGKRNAALVVKGNLTNKKPVYFNMETLMTIKPVSFVITNRWNKKKEKYTGISFIQLLNHIGIDKKAEVVDVIARNDYKVSIRINDLRRFEYILSYKLDDQLYHKHDPPENKGPIAIAINFDKHPEMDIEIYKHQLVWFVRTIIVR